MRGEADLYMREVAISKFRMTASGPVKRHLGV
jgi:hypothetical protein